MKTQLIVSKPDGKGYASKSSASNALRALKKLNGEVFKAQTWSHVIVAYEGGYAAKMEYETDDMFPSIIEPENRVIYRTKTDKKYDRPMFDGRPKEKTEREREVAELQEELDRVKRELELVKAKLEIHEESIDGEAYYIPTVESILETLKGREHTDAYKKALVDVHYNNIIHGLKLDNKEGGYSVEEIIQLSSSDLVEERYIAAQQKEAEEWKKTEDRLQQTNKKHISWRERRALALQHTKGTQNV